MQTQQKLLTKYEFRLPAVSERSQGSKHCKTGNSQAPKAEQLSRELQCGHPGMTSNSAPGYGLETDPAKPSLNA